MVRKTIVRMMRFKRTIVYINTNARTEYKEKYLKTFLFSKKKIRDHKIH